MSFAGGRDLRLSFDPARDRAAVRKSTRPRVIVIDDSPDVCADIQRVLSRSQTPERMSEVRAKLFGDTATHKTSMEFDVDIALQGKEGADKVAEAAAAAHPYTLAFVDMRMPPG